jgi:hypothetical protein
MVRVLVGDGDESSVAKEFLPVRIDNEGRCVGRVGREGVRVTEVMDAVELLNRTLAFIDLLGEDDWGASRANGSGMDTGAPPVRI